MLKTLVAALLAASIASVSFVAAAQAHHKTGHCVPGILTAGCPIKPQAPQLPNPNPGN